VTLCVPSMFFVLTLGSSIPYGSSPWSLPVSILSHNEEVGEMNRRYKPSGSQ
jgi:hypothetical protein